MPTTPNTIQLKKNGQIVYPITDVSCVMGLNGSAVTEAILCWDGASTPVVANIPAGVVVTYNTTNYTGTLAASSSTTGKIYMVATGTANNYDRYMTFASGSSYAWENIGDTTIDLTTYATQAELDQLEADLYGIQQNYAAGYYDTTGAVQSSDTWYYGIDYIPVSANDSVEWATGGNDGNCRLVIYDANKDVLQTYGANANPRTVTMPSDSAFVRPSFKVVTSNIIKVNGNNAWSPIDGTSGRFDNVDEDIEIIEGKVDDVSNALYATTGQTVSLGIHRNGNINMAAVVGWENRSLPGHYMIPVVGGVEYIINTPAVGYNYAFLKTMPTYSNEGIRPETYPDMATGFTDTVSLASGNTTLITPYDAHYLYVYVFQNMADPTLKVGDGLVARVDKLTDRSSGNAFYYGEKISLNRQQFVLNSFGTIYNAGHQGGACYDDKFFLCLSTGNVIVYDLVNKATLGTFSLGVALHCNAVFFGEKYSASDDFPVLYVNSYEDGIQKGTLYGFRITEIGGVFSCSNVQTINVGFTNSSLWTDGAGDTRTYGNFVLDKENGILYAYTLLDTTNVTRFFAFEMPSPTGGNVTYSESDIIERFDIQRLAYMQDSCFVNGQIFIESGGVSGAPGLISVVSMIQHSVIAQINLPEIGISIEPESIDYYEDGLLFGMDTFYTAKF